MALALGLALLLQQAAASPAQQQTPAPTTPPSRDTIGYWQQGIAYRIVATLDESAQKLRARGDLVYVNRSPTVVREMFFHQYLNAFRPHSKWSEVDEREGRVRFQNLREPDYGYERFTAVPTFDGVPVAPYYPGSPDSTVVRFALPRALNPGDSVVVHMEWDARPSTVPRRQGRRGRTWDFAQWYPKVAVYDRSGWEPNALQPAGELYGEYGTYDVTTIVRDDQVLASTGVPMSGDPGWERVRRGGEVYTAARAYDTVARPAPASDSTLPDSVPRAPGPPAPQGYRAVRWLARDVHHFAWSASPDYRYEGGRYVRALPATHFRAWDTVAVNVLYKQGDDTTWGGGRALNRTLFALRWLESIYGAYAYPQITNVHRLDGGGTEFPMMVMDGDPSQGLILHEAGHIYSYGILGNNEWRSGWMDEGLTSYQTSWALGQTPQERLRAGTIPEPGRIPAGYRALGSTLSPADQRAIAQTRLELQGRSQPIGTNAGDFRDFATYNQMIYGRAEVMYGQLRDAVGDTVFRYFLRDYYHRWALKHVDELAMRASAERMSGRDLGWFFQQWVHETGLLDYALTAARSEPRGAGWVTRATISRRGEYRHPMPVGVLTSRGWTIARGDPRLDTQTLEIATSERPIEVRIDPYHFTWDWNRRNDASGRLPLALEDAKVTFDWPFLDQATRDRTLLALTPIAWTGDAPGAVLGARARASYLAAIDRWEVGLAYGLRNGTLDTPTETLHGSALTRINAWARVTNPYLPWSPRPLYGQSLGAGWLDGILKLDWSWALDGAALGFIPAAPAATTTLYATGAYPTDRVSLPEGWDFANVSEVGIAQSARLPVWPNGSVTTARWSLGGGLWGGRAFSSGQPKAYLRLEASATHVEMLDSATALVLRGYAGAATEHASQRGIYLSAADPFATFYDHWYRPRGALLKEEGFHFVPFGGAGMRGWSPIAQVGAIGAVNASLERRLATLDGWMRGLTVWGSAFGDAAAADGGALSGDLIADAGAGVSLRGRLYDRDVRLRFDLPILVTSPAHAVGKRPYEDPSFAFRWTVTLGDIW